MVDFAFRGSPEAGLLPALRPAGTFRGFSRPRLQFETPIHVGRTHVGRTRGGRSRTNLHFLVSRLEPEHLHFHRVGSGREIGQFVIAGLIGGGYRAVTALSRDHGRARQRLPAELDGACLCAVGLRAQQRAQ